METDMIVWIIFPLGVTFTKNGFAFSQEGIFQKAVCVQILIFILLKFYGWP